MYGRLMSKFLSIAVLVCFTLISALANIGDSDAGSFGEEQVQTQLPTEQQSNLLAALLMDVDRSGSQKDECPCEKESSSTKFVCGVALALTSPAAIVHPPVREKSRYAVYKPAALKSFVDLLKRPPRTVL